MSREILFKAKRKNWRELPKEEWWVEGDVIHEPYGVVIQYYVDKMRIKVVIDPETLCQYTGMTDGTKWKQLSAKEKKVFLSKWNYKEDCKNRKEDWNGKMIWENDILHRAYHSEDDCIVVWNDGRLCFKTIHGQYNQDPMTLSSLCFTQRAVERLTVIGNIFDNPELLGGAE